MKNNELILVNCDTDSLMVTKKDQSDWTEVEQSFFLKELNSIFPEKIHFEDDGTFEKVLVVKSKNYILQPKNETKLKIKGSGFKDSKKEAVLKEFMIKVVELLMNEKSFDDINNLYFEYCKKCFNLKDIKPWCKKVTVTDKVLNCKGHEDMSPEEKKENGIRPNEYKVYDAIKHKNFQEGDKIYLYFKKDGSLSLYEEFDGDYDEFALVGKLNSCLKTFNNLIDISKFVKYHNKTKRKLLLELLEKENV